MWILPLPRLGRHGRTGQTPHAGHRSLQTPGGYLDIPTLSELGYPINVLTLFWSLAPRGTPRENIQKVYEAHKKAAEERGKEIAETLKKVGA